ncbi:DUF397 domain-containing protein [Streptomyces chrestomyceticus]|nr:DUF397 domain-containing protein [Streptomyces chrestomyceticus]
MATQAFRKSSYSNAHEECVEVAVSSPDAVAIRGSKHPTGPILHLSPAAWASFRTSVRSGWFEH